jgi:hypothetical protein
VRPSLLLGLGLLTFFRLPILWGQGVAGAVVEGEAVDSVRRPFPGAAVILRHLATGAEYRASTDARGRFRLEVQPVSGPWIIEVRAIGHQPSRAPLLKLEVGDLVFRRIELGAAAASTLPDVTVNAAPIPVDGGPGSSIPGHGLRSLPIENRDFTRLFAAMPQALGRDLNAIGGQHPGYNAILLDGATAADLYGVGRTPGSTAGAKAISLEALDGLRVMIAPMDVRQGGFSGGVIHAVTRSGTNRFEGSAFTSMARPFLVGSDTAGRPPETFDRLQYGLTLGGPIVRNRLHFFTALDIQRSTTPFVGPEAGAPGTGISDSTARRAAEVFRRVYGFDAGSPAAPVLEQPDRDWFAKLSWQAGPGARIEVTHNWVKAREGSLNREVRTGASPNRNGWQLSNSGSTRYAEVQATRLHAWMARGRWSNEFMAGYQTIGERRESALPVPLFLVQTDQTGTWLAGGSPVDAQGTVLDQRLIELSNNSTWTMGRHELTAGGRMLLLHVLDNLFVNNRGLWRFPSVDALERLAADYYEVNLPLLPGGPLADFDTRLLAGYLQDRWTPHPRVTVTAGLRVEAPFVDHPPTNRSLDTASVLGRVNTGDFPSGAVEFQPRIGAQVDLSGSWRTVLRMGLGVFTATPPINWLGGAFINTGLALQNLRCTPTRGGVPPPITDPAQRPATCLTSAGQAPPPSSVVAFSPEFRFPEAVKLLAGIDHSFRSGVSASFDLVLSRTRNSAYLSDLNLRPGSTSAEGRLMYGSITGTGAASANRLDPRFLQVLFVTNRSQDRFRAVSLSVRKSWRHGGYVQAGGQWSRTEDVFTVNRNSANLTLQTAPIDGTLAERNLTRSGYDVPISLTANGAMPLPGGFTLSLLARHQSGRPYAYAVTGDANADGIDGSIHNDLFYVPRSAADISLADPAQYGELDRFIEEEECLRSQRGRIMVRNSCRNPSFTLVDARVAWETTLLTRRVEVSADLFNLLHLLHGSWGLVRETSANEARDRLVTMTGWDATHNRPIYSLFTQAGHVVLPPRNQVLVDLSRWRVQLGARVQF